MDGRWRRKSLSGSWFRDREVPAGQRSRCRIVEGMPQQSEGFFMQMRT
jgi:hypothetical protein